MKSKIYMETYGCSFNQASSEIIQGLLLNDENQLVTSIEDSDIIIINTCIVKTNTEARILNKINKFTKKFPNKGLLIMGCMPEVLDEKLRQINPRINMLGPHYVTHVSKAIQSINQGKQFIQIGKRKESKLCLPRNILNPRIAKVQIAQGCLNKCAYCITKYAMGNLKSYPLPQILEEIELDIQRGSKEIWLTAQDTGCYGYDVNRTLPELLHKIVQLPPEFRIRVGMMNPKSFMKINHQLVQILTHQKIYNFLHIPIQSGNDEILQKMNRTYVISELQAILSQIKQTIPDLALSIDVIVGFPAESDSQFEDTISFVKKTQPDIVNISKFGARPKTPAAKMKPVPTKIVKERSSLLSQICNEISTAQNKNYLKTFKKQSVLTIAHGKKGGIIARTNNYKPVILKEECKLGSFYDVQLVTAHRNYLTGVLL